MNDLEAKEIKDFLEKATGIISNLTNQLEKANNQIEESKPKVDVFDHLVFNGQKENATDLFKKLKFCVNGKEKGRNTAYKFLRDIGIFMPNNTPYIPYAKYFKVKTTYNTINTDFGEKNFSHNVPAIYY